MNNTWYKFSLWKKRLHGWATYQVCAWLSLLFPIEVDRALHKTLNDQFGSN